MKLKLRLSIKLFLAVAIILFINLALIWVFGNMFLEDYYLENKRTSLSDGFHDMLKVYADGDSERLQEQIAALESGNDRVQIYAEYEQTAILGMMQLKRQVYLLLYKSNQLGANLNNYLYLNELLSTTINPSNERMRDTAYIAQLVTELDGQLYGFLDSEGNALLREQLFLFGQLDDGVYVFLSTPLESIQESAALAMRFSLLAGVIALLAGVLVTFLLSVAFTRPIRQMTAVAGEMANLDFSQRITVRSHDEVGTLGESINTMAASLERYTQEVSEANAQLKRDIEERMISEQSQKALVSNISHELKTPLSIISGYAEGLKAGLAAEPDMRDEYCDAILEESRNMTHLIQNLLRLSRLQSGTTQPRYTEVFMAELIERLMASLSLQTAQKELSVETDCVKTPPAWADRDACEQVARNFVVNAIRHTPQGGRLHVSTNMHGGRLRLEVYNSGSHVADEDIDKIWDSFYRADTARNRDTGEVGLGLAIVKAHMNAHNQRFGCYNAVDGVVFFAEWAVSG